MPASPKNPTPWQVAFPDSTGDPTPQIPNLAKPPNYVILYLPILLLMASDRFRTCFYEIYIVY